MKNLEGVNAFNELVAGKKPILLDFYADWCGPCQTLLPTIEALSQEHQENIEILKVNVDTQQELASKFGVRSIPALFFIKNGEVVERLVGLQAKQVLESKIEQYTN